MLAAHTWNRTGEVLDQGVAELLLQPLRSGVGGVDVGAGRHRPPDRAQRPVAVDVAAAATVSHSSVSRSTTARLGVARDQRRR